MNVGEICVRDVVIVRADEPLITAARLMRDFGVGDVVVVDAVDGLTVPLGIITDRDIIIGPVATNPESVHALTVRDVANTNLVTVRGDEDVLSAVDMMRRHGVRRLPVVEPTGALLGIVSFDDLVEVLGRELVGLGAVPSQGRRRETHAQVHRAKG